MIRKTIMNDAFEIQPTLRGDAATITPQMFIFAVNYFINKCPFTRTIVLGGEVIAICGVFLLDPGRAECFMAVSSKVKEHKELFKTAIRVVIVNAFSLLHLHSIETTIKEDLDLNINFAKMMGFKPIGALEDGEYELPGRYERLVFNGK